MKNAPMAYSIETKEAAKKLFIRGAKPSEIQQRLNLANERVIYYWAAKDCWGELIAHDAPLDALDRRLVFLLDSCENEPTDKKLNALERLTVIRGKLLSQARQKNSTSGEQSEKSTTKKNKKNDVSGITKAMFDDWFDKKLFDYQKEVRKEKADKTINRVRNYLKSRQIGFTWYFSHEAFEDAVLTGDNQIFLSASKAQAQLFRINIILFAQEFGVELKGNPMLLSSGATLYFVSTNASTAQGPQGHLYTDEYFWIQSFNKLQTVTSGMASQKKWRKTYFSTPSTVDHEAYSFWSGDKYKNSKRKNKKPWPSDKEISKGALCPDGQYRKIVTILDAIKGGCDLFDLEQLRDEYEDDAFDMLFMCIFLNDALGIFKLCDLEKCLGDTYDWKDFNADNPRPFGERPVWIGYDPSRTRDDASCMVLAPPLEPGGEFRVIEEHQWRDKTYIWQAEQIKKLTTRFNVQHIGIDITGTGYGVYDSINKFFPRAKPIHYSLETKTALVLKAQEVIKNHRIKWDAAKTEIAAAFLTIKRTTTPSGSITYSSRRTDLTGHADRAWAIMHALSNEPLTYNHHRRTIMKVIG